MWGLRCIPRGVSPTTNTQNFARPSPPVQQLKQERKASCSGIRTRDPEKQHAYVVPTRLARVAHNYRRHFDRGTDETGKRVFTDNAHQPVEPVPNSESKLGWVDT